MLYYLMVIFGVNYKCTLSSLLTEDKAKIKKQSSSYYTEGMMKMIFNYNVIKNVRTTSGDKIGA